MIKLKETTGIAGHLAPHAKQDSGLYVDPPFAGRAEMDALLARVTELEKTVTELGNALPKPVTRLTAAEKQRAYRARRKGNG